MKKSKKIALWIAAIVAVVAVGGSVYWFSMPVAARNMVLFMMVGGDSYENYAEYQVIERNEDVLDPAAFETTVASGDNSNIVVVTEIVQNEDSKMLKRGMVQPTGSDDYMGWSLMADEGFEEGVNTFGPSPLSYYTSGIAANLHTQVLRAAEVKGVELDSVKVEVLNNFYWEDMMSAEGAGFLGQTNTNIIIESSESEEVIQEIKEMAINSWTAGEALANETIIEPSLLVNGDDRELYRSAPGTSLSDESFEGDLRISYITEGPKESDYLDQSADDVGDQGIDGMSNLKFEILAISESAENSERPYLKKITVSFNTPTSETWEIYSDEMLGENDIPLAPTSLEYFTAGTSLCLTSQIRLVSAMMALDSTEFRVEQQTDYRQENVATEDMAGYTDIAHSYIVIESDEPQERLEAFFNKSLSLCFAGEGLKGATEMNTAVYLNGEELK